jgi:hypothetical protein
MSRMSEQYRVLCIQNMAWGNIPCALAPCVTRILLMGLRERGVALVDAASNRMELRGDESWYTGYVPGGSAT